MFTEELLISCMPHACGFIQTYFFFNFQKIF